MGLSTNIRYLLAIWLLTAWNMALYDEGTEFLILILTNFSFI